MGHFSYSTESGHAVFVVEWGEHSTICFGELQERDAIYLALQLIDGAIMSQPVKIGSLEPPDSQGGTIFLQARMACNRINAMALLASGFVAEDEAAEIINSFNIPSETIQALQHKVKQMHEDECKRMRPPNR